MENPYNRLSAPLNFPEWLREVLKPIFPTYSTDRYDHRYSTRYSSCRSR